MSEVAIRTVSSVTLAALISVFGLAGCGSEEPPIGPPSDWESTGDRWWRSDIDTTGLFRALDSFEDMGVQTDRASMTEHVAQGQTLSPTHVELVNSVRERFKPFYHNQPEIADSLFRRYAIPVVSRASITDQEAYMAERQRISQEVYRTLSQHFRQPRTRLSLGDEVPVAYPDSLRNRGVGGTVETQAYLNEDGEPLSVKLINGVHPVLDEIAMNATTRMRWNPAYLRGEPIPSWARLQVTFRPPSETQN